MHETVWFITGASRGFGPIRAEAALERGDRVAATARKLADVEVLTGRFGDRVLPVALDVDNAEQVRTAVSTAHTHFCRLDVVLNSVGYSRLPRSRRPRAGGSHSVARLSGLLAEFFLLVKLLALHRCLRTSPFP